MADEAGEAADYSPSGVYLTAIKAGYSAEAAHGLAALVRGAHAAGVAEGIRQAREAVARDVIDMEERSDYGAGFTSALERVVEAIDALGGTTDD